MAQWVCSGRTGQVEGTVSRFDPRFWTVDFPRPMMASVVTTGPDALRVAQLGRALGRALRSYPEDLTVGLLGTGGMSHQLAGARAGFINPDFDALWMQAIETDPARLAAEIDPNLHSCGSVRATGAADLAHPEPGFYIVGAKSYGRAPTFLAMTGFEQVRSVVAAIAGLVRWRQVQRAMRRGQALPVARTVVVLAVGLAVVAVGVCVLLVAGG